MNAIQNHHDQPLSDDPLEAALYTSGFQDAINSILRLSGKRPHVQVGQILELVESLGLVAPEHPCCADCLKLVRLGE